VREGFDCLGVCSYLIVFILRALVKLFENISSESLLQSLFLLLQLPVSP
jgi:hypothetical protein